MKKLILLFSASIGLLIGLQAFSTTIPWYMKDIPHMTHHLYPENCATIKYRQHIRTFFRRIHSLIVHRNNIDSAIQEIDAELEAIRAKFINKEKKALQKIKEKYDLDNHIWSQCLDDIKRVKQHNLTSLKSSQQNASHDENVSQEIKNILCDLLKQNDIHPLSISVTMADSENNALEAEAVGSVVYTDDQETLIIYPRYVIQEITFWMKNCTNSEELLAICAHEVEHILQQHMITRRIIKLYLRHYYTISADILNGCDAFNRLIKAQEQQAEIFAALRDPHVAHCMALKRKCKYYPNYLYEKHYYYLSTIDMLWKLRTYLISVKDHGGIVDDAKMRCKKLLNFI